MLASMHPSLPLSDDTSELASKVHRLSLGHSLEYDVFYWIKDSNPEFDDDTGIDDVYGDSVTCETRWSRRDRKKA